MPPELRCDDRVLRLQRQGARSDVRRGYGRSCFAHAVLKRVQRSIATWPLEAYREMLWPQREVQSEVYQVAGIGTAILSAPVKTIAAGTRRRIACENWRGAWP